MAVANVTIEEGPVSRVTVVEEVGTDHVSISVSATEVRTVRVSGDIGPQGPRGASGFDMLSLRDFGALGDNVDDTDAIWDAIAASDASGKVVYASAGNYKFFGELNSDEYPNFMGFVGESPTATRFVGTSLTENGMRFKNPP